MMGSDVGKEENENGKRGFLGNIEWMVCVMVDLVEGCMARTRKY